MDLAELSRWTLAWKLTECPWNYIHLVHDAIPVADAPPSGSIQSHSMNLIYKGDGTEFMGCIAHLLQWTHSTCLNNTEVQPLTIETR